MKSLRLGVVLVFLIFLFSQQASAGWGTVWNQIRDWVKKNNVVSMYSSWDHFLDTLTFSLLDRTELLSGCSEQQMAAPWNPLSTSAGFELACFTDTQKSRFKQVIDFMARDPRNDYPEIGNPLNYVRRYTQRYVNEQRSVFATSKILGNEHAGFTVAGLGGNRGVTYLTSLFFNLGTLVEQSAILVHEAAHVPLGLHNCGWNADFSANKVFGLEIRYLMELASGNHPDLACRDRSFIVDLALTENLGNICSPEHRVDLDAYKEKIGRAFSLYCPFSTVPQLPTLPLQEDPLRIRWGRCFPTAYHDRVVDLENGYIIASCADPNHRMRGVKKDPVCRVEGEIVPCSIEQKSLKDVLIKFKIPERNYVPLKIAQWQDDLVMTDEGYFVPGGLHAGTYDINSDSLECCEATPLPTTLPPSPSAAPDECRPQAGNQTIDWPSGIIYQACDPGYTVRGPLNQHPACLLEPRGQNICNDGVRDDLDPGRLAVPFKLPPEFICEGAPAAQASREGFSLQRLGLSDPDSPLRDDRTRYIVFEPPGGRTDSPCGPTIQGLSIKDPEQDDLTCCRQNLALSPTDLLPIKYLSLNLGLQWKKFRNASDGNNWDHTITVKNDKGGTIANWTIYPRTLNAVVNEGNRIEFTCQPLRDSPFCPLLIQVNDVVHQERTVELTGFQADGRPLSVMTQLDKPSEGSKEYTLLLDYPVFSDQGPPPTAPVNANNHAYSFEVAIKDQRGLRYINKTERVNGRRVVVQRVDESAYKTVGSDYTFKDGDLSKVFTNILGPQTVLDRNRYRTIDFSNRLNIERGVPNRGLRLSSKFPLPISSERTFTIAANIREMSCPATGNCTIRILFQSDSSEPNLQLSIKKVTSIKSDGTRTVIYDDPNPTWKESLDVSFTP